MRIPCGKKKKRKENIHLEPFVLKYKDRQWYIFSISRTQGLLGTGDCSRISVFVDRTILFHAPLLLSLKNCIFAIKY